MLYSTLLVATAALSGFVAAQNSSTPDNLELPSGFETCCDVPANQIPETQREQWCDAQENTCPEICGGQGEIASGGNTCDDDTLEYECKCRNGTTPDMDKYQQSVPGQMCRFWFDLCINATLVNGEGNRAWQYGCEQTRNQRCGNLTTTDPDAEDSSSTTRSSRPTASSTGTGSGSSDSTPTATSSDSAGASETPGSAVRLVQEFGAPVLAGGIIAFFGIGL